MSDGAEAAGRVQSYLSLCDWPEESRFVLWPQARNKALSINIPVPFSLPSPWRGAYIFILTINPHLGEEHGGVIDLSAKKETIHLVFFGDPDKVWAHLYNLLHLAKSLIQQQI